MKTLFFFCLIGLLTGCSVAVDEQCKQWQSQGEMFSSMQNCVSCGDALGIEDLNAVRACAFKKDADSIRNR
jgi:hypothetical protein